MAIDWRDKTPGAPNARPRIDPVTTLIAVDGLEIRSHCASLPRHDERGVYTHANPDATVDGTPLGRNPNWGA